MSAAIPREIESKESDLTEIGQVDKTQPAGRVKRWTALLSLMTPPFSVQRVVSGLAAQDGWAKIWGVYGGAIKTALGILAGIITVYGSYTILPTRHEMAVSAGKDLTVSYHPQKDLVRLVFNVQAEEFGSKANQILAAQAWVEQPLTSKHLLQNGRPEFEENDLRTYEPIIPAGPRPKNMQCSICFRLDDSARHAFQNGGFRRLVVNFKDKAGENHSVTFCFNIGDDQLLGFEEKKFQYISEDVLCPD